MSVATLISIVGTLICGLMWGLLVLWERRGVAIVKGLRLEAEIEGLNERYDESLADQNELRREINKLNGMVIDEQRKAAELLKQVPVRDEHGKFAPHEAVEEAFRHAL